MSNTGGTSYCEYNTSQCPPQFQVKAGLFGLTDANLQISPGEFLMLIPNTSTHKNIGYNPINWDLSIMPSIGPFVRRHESNFLLLNIYGAPNG